MSKLISRLLKRTMVRPRRAIRVFLVAASAAILVGVNVFATVGDARSPKAHAAKAPVYVRACDQKTGPAESMAISTFGSTSHARRDRRPSSSLCTRRPQRAVPPALGGLPALTGLLVPRGPRGPGPRGPQGPQGPALFKHNSCFPWETRIFNLQNFQNFSIVVTNHYSDKIALFIDALFSLWASV